MISRLMLSFLLWMFIVLTVVVLETSGYEEKVLLKDVSAITLHNKKMTTGRRVAPTLQLKCVGGSAKGAFTPKTVQCVNQGFDGSDVQWRCDADLPNDIEFGSISVSCEGYSYANDPYILKGSCGLEYELDYTNGSGRSVSRKSSQDRWDQFATFVVVAFIGYIIYVMWTNRNQDPENSGYSRGGHGGPGGPGSGGGGPGGYPSAPPPYDDNYGKPPPYGFRGDSSQSSGGCQGGSSGGGASGSGSGGSFWTGATLGAIGGYLANSMFNNNNGYYPRQRYNNRFFQDTGFSSSDSWSSPSTSTRSSSGYGGTTRR